MGDDIQEWFDLVCECLLMPGRQHYWIAGVSRPDGAAELSRDIDEAISYASASKRFVALVDVAEKHSLSLDWFAQNCLHDWSRLVDGARAELAV